MWQLQSSNPLMTHGRTSAQHTTVQSTTNLHVEGFNTGGCSVLPLSYKTMSSALGAPARGRERVDGCAVIVAAVPASHVP